MLLIVAKGIINIVFLLSKENILLYQKKLIHHIISTYSILQSQIQVQVQIQVQIPVQSIVIIPIILITLKLIIMQLNNFLYVSIGILMDYYINFINLFSLYIYILF